MKNEVKDTNQVHERIEVKETDVENEEVAQIIVGATDEEEEQETEKNEILIQEEPKVEEKKKELEFIYPVEGELFREFAKDNLVYSETLKEWVTHTGVDILADKTTVVKASEERNSNCYKE